MNIMNNAAEVQQETINAARQSKELFDCIMGIFDANQGIIDRKEMIPAVADALGLTDVEAAATHITESGKERNYLNSVIDWFVADVKNGAYGEHISIETDGSGVWILDGVFDMTKSHRVYDKKLANTITKKKELKTKYQSELSGFYKLLGSSQKRAFKKAGGDMTKCISSMYDAGLTAEQAIFEVIT